MGHVPAPLYKDPALFDWLFNCKLDAVQTEENMQ